MLRQRTDLAMEAREIWQASAGETTKLPGVRAEEELVSGCAVTKVDILDAEGAAALGKPVGRYRTVDISPYFRRRSEGFADTVEALAGQLRELLPAEGVIFVAGLGNRAMTPDAIGPLAVEQLLITRHLAETLPGFRPVAAAAAGVLAGTGMESAEWVRGLSRAVEAGCVIAVDALAARSLRRVCTTVQLSDTGIIPGSGIGNHRAALDRERLGIPVISIGAPTVVSAATLAADLLPPSAQAQLTPPEEGMFVTPRDVDARVRDIARLIACAIGLAAQPALTLEDLTALLA